MGSLWARTLTLILLISISWQSSEARGKKKVVIIGEMSELAYELASNSTSNYALSDVTFEDYDEFALRTPSPLAAPTRPHRRVVVGKRSGYQSGQQGQPSSGQFVPVAAYSVTHSRVGSGQSGQQSGVRRQRQPVRKSYQLMPAASSQRPGSSGKTTESAVYGYMNQKPEIVEFRGQYFYGQNGNGVPTSLEPMTSASNAWSPLRISAKSGGLGPGGLLLATLPLILAPMLSYLFTPMIIPVTATIAAGRRRRRRGAFNLNLNLTDGFAKTKHHQDIRTFLGLETNTVQPPTPDANDGHDWDLFSSSSSSSSSKQSRLDPRLKEIQVVADYLRKVHFDEKDRDKAMANYLQCDGMLDTADHCLERLACEFSDPASYGAPELDRAVTSILIGHILQNTFIGDFLKKKLKTAAVFGRDHSGQCARFVCTKVN